MQYGFQTFFMLTLAPFFFKCVRPAILWFGANPCKACSVNQSNWKPYTPSFHIDYIKYLFTLKFFLYDTYDFAFQMLYSVIPDFEGVICVCDDTSKFLFSLKWYGRQRLNETNEDWLKPAVHCTF